MRQETEYRESEITPQDAWLEEGVDSSTDPQVILLMREGAGMEAYIMQREQLAGRQQAIEKALTRRHYDVTEYMERQQQRTRKSSTH